MGGDGDSGNGTGTSSGSENSGYGASNSASSANLGSDGQVGGPGSGTGDRGVDVGAMSESGWSSFMDTVTSTLSNISTLSTVASLIGLNPAVAAPAYGMYKAFDYAWSVRGDESKWGDVSAPPNGGSPGSDTPKYISNQAQIRQDWANYLTDISNRTKSRRVAGQTEEGNDTFTSLLKG